MAVEELQVRATLRDELSGGIRRIRTEVGRLTDQSTGLGRTTSRLGTGLSSMGKLGGKAMMGLGRAAKYGVVGAGAALTVLGKQAVSTTSDVNESINKTNVIFGKSAKGVQEWAETTATSMGIAKGEALDAVANLGGLFQGAGQTKADAAALGQEFTGLAADMGSFFNASNDDVLLALRSGLTGEAEPLRKYGVFLNDAKVQAEGLAMGLVKEGEAMTDEQKIMARQAIIMRETAKAHGDFAETVDSSLPNTMKTLKATFSDTLASLGNSLLPVLLEVANVVKDVIAPVLEPLGPILETVARAIGTTLGPVLKAIVPIIKFFGELFADILEVVGPIVTALASALMPVFKALKPALEPLVAALGDGLLAVVTAIAPVLPDLAQSFADMMIALTPLIPLVADLVALLLKVGGPVLAKVIGAAAGMASVLAGVISTVVSGVMGFINILISGVNWITSKINDLLEVSIDVPDWLPGPDRLSFDAPDIPQIPSLSLGAGPNPGVGTGASLATGGRAGRGLAHLVGERGPEIFVPEVDGRVLTNAESRAAMSGATFGDIYVDARGASREIDVARAVKRGIEAYVRDAKERGRAGAVVG